MLALPVIAALALALVVALLAAPRAGAYERPTALERVASIFALREAEVRCPSMEEWVADPIWGGPTEPRAWGYANMAKDYIVLHPALCAGALAVSDSSLPLWQRAAGVLVLVHEAYHVRRWSGRWDEAKVECRAIRDFTKAVVLFGASSALANELLPWALAVHLRMGALFAEYRDRNCKLPVWAPPISP